MESVGIHTIRDVYNNHELRFMSREELEYNFGSFGNFMQYFGLVKSIPQKWNDKLKEADYEDSIDPVWEIINKNSPVRAEVV